MTTEEKNTVDGHSFWTRPHFVNTICPYERVDSGLVVVDAVDPGKLTACLNPASVDETFPVRRVHDKGFQPSHLSPLFI
jgi:hypothetical protein